MTDTKTKPHGWAIKHPIRGVDGSTAYGLKIFSDEDDAQYELGYYSEPGWEKVPVCLVPPALLDWCEEVEKFFQDELKWGMIEDPESVKKLLDKLKEVRK